MEAISNRISQAEFELQLELEKKNMVHLEAYLTAASTMLVARRQRRRDRRTRDTPVAVPPQRSSICCLRHSVESGGDGGDTYVLMWAQCGP